jgi:hypothetical protein
MPMPIGRAQRLSLGVASVSVAVSVLAVTFVSRLQFSGFTSITRFWLAFTVVVPTTGLFISLSALAAATPLLFICAGAMFGFVIVGSMSIGVYFAPAAGVLLIAALVHLTYGPAQHGWRTAAPFLWLLAGFAGLGPVMIFLSWWHTSRVDYNWTKGSAFGYVHEESSMSIPPLAIWETWALVVIAAALAVGYGISYLRSSARASSIRR